MAAGTATATAPSCRHPFAVVRVDVIGDDRGDGSSEPGAPGAQRLGLELQLASVLPCCAAVIMLPAMPIALALRRHWPSTIRNRTAAKLIGMLAGLRRVSVPLGRLRPHIKLSRLLQHSVARIVRASASPG